jgi:hypothetical protein
MASAIATRCSWQPEGCRAAVAQMVFNTDQTKRRGPADHFLQLRELEGQLDVLEPGQHRNQVKILKHQSHADVLPCRELVIAEL